MAIMSVNVVTRPRAESGARSRQLDKDIRGGLLGHKVSGRYTENPGTKEKKVVRDPMLYRLVRWVRNVSRSLSPKLVEV